MFERLKGNIAQEKKILADMKAIYLNMQRDPKNKNFYLKSINSMMKQVYLLNRAVPELLKEWSPILGTGQVQAQKPVVPSAVRPPTNAPELPLKAKEPVKPLPTTNVVQPAVASQNPAPAPVQNTVNVSYVDVDKKSKKKNYITLDKKDRREYLKSLQLSERGLLSLDKGKKKKEEVSGERKVNPYAKFSNKYFRKYSEKIAPSFAEMGKDLKRANLPFLLSTYLSMAILTSIIGFFAGVLIYGVLLVFSFSNWIHAWIPFVVSGGVLIGFYLYPGSEASGVQKKIAYELPFASIHMAAIAGSDIEPTKIFKIIANSKEYPHVGNEIRKVIIQTDIYGYDLVAALKNVAARTSSKRLGELFSGLATNISTGGQLKNFLEKKAENYLLDYKLERQKYSDLAGTFMDVYISILIAAPLVLMMMFIVMNVAGMSMGGLGIGLLLTLSIVGIAVVNVIFIFVLNMKQPKV